MKNLFYQKSFQILFRLILMTCILSTAYAQKSNVIKPNKELLKTIGQNFIDADKQYSFLSQHLSEGKFPKTYNPTTKEYEFSDSGWWCSGFYPGSLLYLYEQNRNQSNYDEAMRMLKLLEKEKNNTETHDLGFMMYCSFGNAQRIANKPEYKDIILTSAKSLASRFNPTVGCIKSWDTKDPSTCLVIIDNMMNLEMLFWASKVSGDPTFSNIAITHANTTMKNHFRSDYSSYHVVEYDAQTGRVKKRHTAQGTADESAWARGQAWGLYGYVVMYRETKDKKYLDQANHIASFILNNPNLPADKIPYWDFNAPGIPNAFRDSSAASIMASAFLELYQYVDATTAKKYVTVAETILKNLSSPAYKAALNTNGGFLIEHGVGHMPAKTEIDVPLTYGDYYFIEAMLRYQKLEH